MTFQAPAKRIACVLLLLAFSLSFLAATNDALAWGEEGHRMVGEIASRYLTASAQKQIKALLEYDLLADGEPSGRQSLAEVASWADEIRDYDRTKARRTWHYDNVPLCERPDYSRYCHRDRCASAQLQRHLQILADSSASSRRRDEALKWVVHLVGDIHQPLHAATRHDSGGNSVEVSFFGQREDSHHGPLNLHSLWDTYMVRRLIADKGGERAIESERISGPDRAAWERGTISDWVSESHEIAKVLVYRKLPVSVACSRPIEGVVPIGRAYYVAAAPVIERLIQKAGVRLAYILNKALGER